jgi:hypothetical protein
MKKMIRMATMAAALMMAVTTVSKAQGGGGGGGRGNPSARVMAALDSVHASDAIKAKADSIVKATAALTAPLMEAARGGDAEARTKMTDLRTKQNEAIKALLTKDEDKATFDRLTAGGGRRGGGF